MPTETIYYKPLDLSQVAPGCKVAAPDQPPLMVTIGGNDRWINASYTPQLFSCVLCTDPTSIADNSTGASTNANSGSPDVLARFIIMGNAALRPVDVTVFALVNNGGTTGTLTVAYGGATTTQNLTNTTAARYLITVDPTSGSAPQELTISGHTDDSNYVVLVAVLGRYSVTDRTSGGAGADGYIPFGDMAGSIAQSSVASNAPVTTEMMGRGWNNMRAIARDRVACLATLQRPQNLFTSRKTWNTNDANGELIGMVAIPDRSDNVARTIRISCYAVCSGTAAGKITLGGMYNATFNVTTSGSWQHYTFTLPAMYGYGSGPSSFLSWGVVTATGMISSGSGFINLLALQVFRET